MKRISLLALLALTGCATADKITLPGGVDGYAIECQHPGQCYNKASEVCAPGVYAIDDKSSASQGAMMGTGTYASGVLGSKTTLVVRCVSK